MRVFSAPPIQKNRPGLPLVFQSLAYVCRGC